MNEVEGTSMNSTIRAVPGIETEVEQWARAIGQTALAATLYEVAASPKPGLVDPVSAGAHQDMDYFTFLNSAAALAPYFIEFARIGMSQGAGSGEWRGATASTNRSSLLPKLRSVGLEAERAMFAATYGTNTHKGLIFSMGLLCAAAGSLVAGRQAHGERACLENLVCAPACSRAAADIVAGICERELSSNVLPRAPSTSGEALYLQLGVRGIRGEAEAGFPSVIGRALPRLRSDLAAGATYNAAMVDALLELFLCVEDTTVLNRAGVEGLAYVRAHAAQALAHGGMLSEPGKAYIRELDKDFSARSLSPGGCADLLAVTVFLDKLPGALVSCAS